MLRTLLHTTLLAVFLSLPAPAAAEKITVDPNAGAAVVQPAVNEADDSRLAEMVTLDSGSERLHRVVAGISAMTGVDISCGNGEKDWRVRDIPVVVCVKDMPLGKLLRAVADATHTRFEVVGANDPVKRYRIYRRTSEQAEIDSEGQAQNRARLAEAEWQWDAMVEYGRSAELPGVPRRMWLVAKMLAALGPGAKERIFDGQTLRFYSGDPATGKLFDELYMLVWEEEKTRNKAYDYSPTSDDINMVDMRVKLCRTNVELAFGPVILGYDRSNGRERPVYAMDYGHPDDIRRVFQQTRSLPDKGLELPPYPKQHKAPTPGDDMKNPHFAWLRTYNDWQRPLLQAKIDLPKPENDDPTFADLVSAVETASGINIVAEDFRSQLSSKELLVGKVEYGPRFRAGTTIREALAAGPVELVNYDWFLDGNAKLMVGWVRDWRVRHRTLPSEEYLISLRAKANGPGLNFDDVIHLMEVPQEWIGWSRDFYYIPQHILAGDGKAYWWRLYDKLKSEDKRSAKSPDGLSFAKLDPIWISDFIKEQRKERGLSMHTPMSREAGDRDAYMRFVREHYDLTDWAEVDPNVIPTIVMRLQKKPATNRWFDAPGSTQSAPKELNLYTYGMTIRFGVDNLHKSISVPELRFAFPLRSPEREAELLKEITSKSED